MKWKYYLNLTGILLMPSFSFANCSTSSEPVQTNNVLVPSTGIDAKQIESALKCKSKKTCQLKHRIADEDKQLTLHYQPTNDVNSVPHFLALCTKGMPHDELGLPDPDSVIARYFLFTGQDITKMQDIGYPDQIFNPTPIFFTPQLDTNNGFFIRNLFMPHPSVYQVAPPPAWASDETAAEMIELYGASILRDVKFSEYPVNPTVSAVCTYLNAAGNAYKGPKPVTPANLFTFAQQFGRPPLPGNTWVSQLYFLPLSGAAEFNYDVANQIPGKFFPIVGNATSNRFWDSTGNPADPLDYFINSQAVTGQNASINVALYPPQPVEGTQRYVQTGRDLCTRVGLVSPETFIRFLNSLMTNSPIPFAAVSYKDNNLLNPLNPFRQGGIPYSGGNGGSFVNQDFYSWFGEALMQTYTAEGYFKGAFCRVRPEGIGIEVQRTLTLNGISPTYYSNSLLLNSGVLDDVYNLTQATLGTGNYFLSGTNFIGAPTSSAYPSGNATSTGCLATILKAIVSYDYEIPEYVPSADGQSLVATGQMLKLGDEIDKYIFNQAAQRIIANFHYRSDVVAGMLLGEQIAIDYLTRKAKTYTGAVINNGNPMGWRVKKLDGTVIDITIPHACSTK